MGDMGGWFWIEFDENLSEVHPAGLKKYKKISLEGGGRELISCKGSNHHGASTKIM